MLPENLAVIWRPIIGRSDNGGGGSGGSIKRPSLLQVAANELLAAAAAFETHEMETETETDD